MVLYYYYYCYYYYYYYYYHYYHHHHFHFWGGLDNTYALRSWGLLCPRLWTEVVTKGNLQCHGPLNHPPTDSPPNISHRSALPLSPSRPTMPLSTLIYDSVLEAKANPATKVTPRPSSWLKMISVLMAIVNVRIKGSRPNDDRTTKTLYGRLYSEPTQAHGHL